MKSFIQKLLREGLIKEGEVTMSQLTNLEKELDNVFNTIGVDIEFTKHFFERVNDERNERDITIDELRMIFKEVYSEYKNKLKKYGAGFEGVFKNPPTSINIPFILNWDKENQELDLITKTVMRKKDFKSTTPVLPVGSKNKPVPNAPREKPNKFKIGDNIIKYYPESNRFETNKGQPIEIDDIFDSLPEELQDKVMSLMESIELPIEIGDTVLMGKFKNKKVVVKTIEWDEEKGDLTINGKPALKVRIPKKDKK